MVSKIPFLINFNMLVCHKNLKNYIMKIVLIDDHEMILEGYVSILKETCYELHKLFNCEQVYDWLQKGNIPDISLIDYNLPACPDKNLYNGADCALLIHQYAPICKNILITAHDETLILYKIYKSVNLDALIVKADFTSDMIKELINNEIYVPFLSTTVKEAIQENDYDKMLACMGNTLEGVSVKIVPQIGEIKNTLLECYIFYF